MDMYVHKRTNHPPTPTLEPHEVEITPRSNYNQTFRAAVKAYKQHNKLHLIGRGKCSTKTVNIAEDLKSRFPKVNQKTELFHTDTEEVWEPVEGAGESLGLDTLVVTRSVPCMRVVLSREELEGCVAFEQEQRLNGEMVALLKKEAKALRGKSKSRTSSETNAPPPAGVSKNNSRRNSESASAATSKNKSRGNSESASRNKSRTTSESNGAAPAGPSS